MSQPSGVPDDQEFTERYHRALAGFLEFVAMMDVEKHRVAEHLRYPGSDDSPLIGSDVGRELWQRPEGSELTDALLQDPLLASWFSPPNATRLLEIHRRIASFVEKWGESAMAAEAFVVDRADTLLREMRSPTVVVRRYSFFFGVEAASRTELPSGRSIETGTTEAVRSFLGGSGARESDFLRTPARPFTIALGRGACSRDLAGYSAAACAFAWSWVLLENTRWDIWLATGIRPNMGDQFVLEEAEFPVTPFERFPANPADVFSGGGVATINEELLLEIGTRTDALRVSEAFPDDVGEPLRLLARFMQKVVEVRQLLAGLEASETRTVSGGVSDEQPLRSRCSHIARRAYLALLWCSVSIEDGSVVPQLNRDDVLRLLDQGLSGRPRPINEYVPEFVREMGLMPPIPL